MKSRLESISTKIWNEFLLMLGYGLPKWLFLNAKSHFSNSFSSVGKDNTIVGRGRFKAFEQVFAFGI